MINFPSAEQGERCAVCRQNWWTRRRWPLIPQVCLSFGESNFPLNRTMLLYPPKPFVSSAPWRKVPCGSLLCGRSLSVLVSLPQPCSCSSTSWLTVDSISVHRTQTQSWRLWLYVSCHLGLWQGENSQAVFRGPLNCSISNSEPICPAIGCRGPSGGECDAAQDLGSWAL